MLSGPGGAGVRLSWPWLVSADRDGDGELGTAICWSRPTSSGCAGVRVSWPWPGSADRDDDGDGWARRSAGVRQAGVRVCG